jgi:hypothetical protein
MKDVVLHSSENQSSSVKIRVAYFEHQYVTVANDGVNEIILEGLQPYYNPILQVLLEKEKASLPS